MASCKNQVATQPNQTNCNCKKGIESCPVKGNCLEKCVIYQATVHQTNDNSIETYTGLTSRTFKERLYEHTSDFNNIDREGTSLSKHIWELKQKNVPYKISWKYLRKSRSFDPSTRECSLCAKEAYCIIFNPAGATLNQRNEIFSTCRHRLKPLLSNF